MASPPILIENYAQLQTLMAQYMKRQDLNNLIPTFISLAEEWFDDNVYTKARRESYIFKAMQNVTAAPSDWKRIIQAWYNGIRMEYYPSDVDGAYANGSPYTTNNVAPYLQYNTIQIEGDNLVLNVPTLGLICQIDYYVTLEPLSDINVSNWLLEDSPTTYLFGALTNAGIYMRDDVRTQQWQGLRDMAIASKINDSEKSQYQEGPLTIRAG